MFENFLGNNPESKEKESFGNKAEELERLNSYIENTQDPDLKKSLIEKADQLNETLATVELASGLSEDEIMEVYTKMSKNPEVAESILKEILDGIPEKIKGEFSGIGNMAEYFGRTLSPKKAAIVAVALLLFTFSGGDFNRLVGSAEAEENPHDQALSEFFDNDSKGDVEFGKSPAKPGEKTISESTAKSLDEKKKQKKKPKGVSGNVSVDDTSHVNAGEVNK